MGRYIKDIQLDQPIDVVSMVMDDYVYHNRFSRTDWNGELVYYLKDNHGRERYMKWSYAGGSFHVEAWLKSSVGTEMDLDGVGGGASRKEYRRSMDELIATLKNTAPERLSGGHIGSDPLHHSEDYEREHKTWKRDTSWQKRPEPQGRYGTRPLENVGNISKYAGLVVGFVSLVFATMLPIVGLILAVWGLKKIKADSGNGLDKVGRVLCIVSIVEFALVCAFAVFMVVFSYIYF